MEKQKLIFRGLFVCWVNNRGSIVSISFSTREHESPSHWYWRSWRERRNPFHVQHMAWNSYGGYKVCYSDGMLVLTGYTVIILDTHLWRQSTECRLHCLISLFVVDNRIVVQFWIHTGSIEVCLSLVVKLTSVRSFGPALFVVRGIISLLSTLRILARLLSPMR